MKLFRKLIGLFVDPAEKKPKYPPIPGYDYWNYREDLFNPALSFDDIMARSGGIIPRPPRVPKFGEIWEFKDCPKHRHYGWSYPLQILIQTDGTIGGGFYENVRSFIVCGCLTFKGFHPNE